MKRRRRNPDRDGPHDKLFKDTIARAQRHSRDDDAEATMIKIQIVMGGGVLNPVVEHGGDLLWRMTEAGAWTEYGRSAVIDKVDKVIRWLTNDYGFEKEYRENVQSNAAYRGISPQHLQAKLDKLLEKYAEEHAKLPVYNRAQFTARKFSVLIGKQKWKQVIQCGKILLNMAADRAQWLETAGSIDPKYATRSNPVRLPRFVSLPGFPSRPTKLYTRRNPIPPIAHKFLDALERIAGPKQIVYMGPFQFIGDRKGGIYGQLELHFWPHGPKGAYIVHVGYIGVSPEHRRKGYATIMMNMLVQAADEVGMDMNLNISPNTKRGDKSKQMTERQLQRLYAKFGFKSGPGSAWKDMRRTR